MMHLHARNINGMFHEAIWRLQMEGSESSSRNGKVMKLPYPAMLEYSNPMERVLYDPKRDANPFFHLFESVWMISGNNDVETPAKFAAQIKEYSDDGKTLNGAYGHRWRRHFGMDQLDAVIWELKARPDSRRAVLAMWDPKTDIPLMMAGGRDLPCNTNIYFSIRDGHSLDMTVCNRSNDLVWGACGANVVHMSMLQEYIACSLGLPVGFYYQFTNDLHVYERHWDLFETAMPPSDGLDYYQMGKVCPYPLFARPEDRNDFDADCHYWMDPSYYAKTPYFAHVVAPMFRAWEAYKRGDLMWAQQYMQDCGAMDWKVAGMEWLARRAKKLTGDR